MKRQRRFYIVVRSNHQGDHWSPVSGPFLTRKEAEAKLYKYEYYPEGMNALFDELHAKVVSRTELVELGFPRTPEGEARLALNILKELDNPARPWYRR